MPFQLQLEKIQNKISELNQNGTWVQVDGIFAVTQVEAKPDSTVTFNPGAGIVLKLFVNTSTGEIKLFPASSFE